MEEEIHFDRPYMETGNYPTEEMFNKFVINNNGERNGRI